MSELEREKFEALICTFCGEAADHKCGGGHSCGNCCAMTGSVAGEPVYAWIRKVIEPQLRLLRLARSESAPSPTRESLHAEWMAQEEFLDWSNFLLNKLTGEPGESAPATPPITLKEFLWNGTTCRLHGHDCCDDCLKLEALAMHVHLNAAGEAGSPAPAPTEEKNGQ